MPEDNVAETILKADKLRTFINALTPLVDECKIHMGDEGWHVSAVDPANHAMIESLDLPPRAFDHYEAPGSATIGVNLVRLEDYVKPADPGDLVELRIDMETRKLRIHYPNTDTALALIDPDSIRKEPDTPDLDLPNTFTMEGGRWGHVTRVGQLTSTSIRVSASPEERELYFYAEGDVDDTTVTYGDEELTDAKIADDSEAWYSLALLEILTDPIPSDADVTARYGDEFPIRLEWSDLDGDMQMNQLLAPRIKSN